MQPIIAAVVSNPVSHQSNKPLSPYQFTFQFHTFRHLTFSHSSFLLLQNIGLTLLETCSAPQSTLTPGDIPSIVKPKFFAHIDGTEISFVVRQLLLQAVNTNRGVSRLHTPVVCRREVVYNEDSVLGRDTDNGAGVVFMAEVPSTTQIQALAMTSTGTRGTLNHPNDVENGHQLERQKQQYNRLRQQNQEGEKEGVVQRECVQWSGAVTHIDIIEAGRGLTEVALILSWI